MPNVLAVVVGYRNSRLTDRAARSLVQQTVSSNVVVWDNFSTQAEREQLLSLRFPPSVQLVLCSQNLMWAPAINQAIKACLGNEQFILLMNNDCSLPGVTVERLVETFESHSDAGLVGPLVPAIGGPQEPLYVKDKSRPFRTTYLMGACMMIRRSVWDQIGGLDENMPLGADDHDYAIRVKHAGYAIYVDPRICIQHEGHASAGPEWDEWGGRSWAAFNEKWAGYYATEEEATKAHWSGKYDPAFERGTGWTEEEYRARVG